MRASRRDLAALPTMRPEPRTARPIRGRAAAIVILLAGTCAWWTAASQGRNSPAASTKGQAIVVQSHLVVLPVTVTDARGNFIDGLSESDFQIYENGVLQKINRFETGEVPVTVGLVVDHSGSMRDNLPEVAAAALVFANSSNPQDQMFVINFNERVWPGLEAGEGFTSNAKELQAAVSGLFARGETALYDALLAGLKQLAVGKWDRKALVAVSDGGDNASHSNLRQVMEQAEGSGAVIYCIGLRDETGEEQDPGVLRQLARVTGGLAFFPDSTDKVSTLSKKIARDLRAQYTLAYEPESGPVNNYRKIEVRVVAPGHGSLRVRTRKGYEWSEADSTNASDPGERP